MNDSNRRFWEVMIGLFLVMIGLFGVADAALPGLLIVALGGFLLWRQFEGGSTAAGDISLAARMSPRRRDSYDEILTETRQSGAEKVYAHALRAVERAGLNADEVRVLPVDIGVMVYKADHDPVVFRTHDVPDDIDYIQPFVQLRLPTKAVGRIKFEILDSDGQLLFTREESCQLERGRNLVTPSTRLPIHDAQAMQKNWVLRVSADGMPLATHEFAWQESEVNHIRRHITEDGEISNELRATLAENRLQRMSLDELLELQDDERQAQQQRRR